jgi:cell division protein FtsB
MESLEAYKLAYAELQSRYEKLKQENRKLKDEIIILNSSKEVLDDIGSLAESIDQKALNKVYESIRRRHLLGVLLGL